MKSATTLVLLACLLGGCATPYALEPAYLPAPLLSEGTPQAPPAPNPPRPGSSRTLSLEECIEMALRSHRSIRIADRRVLISKDKESEAFALMMPQLLAEGKFSSRINDPGATIGASTFVVGDRSVGTAKASLLVPIYDFGGALNRLDAEESRTAVSGFSAERARQDLVLAVSQGYFRILEARRILKVVEESLSVIARQLTIARDFLAQGIVGRSDVLTVEVQEAERRQDRIRAQNNVELAVATFNRLLSRDVTSAIELADVLESTPWKGTFEATLRMAIEKRPDLEGLKRQVELARSEWKASRVGFYPKIYAFGEYNHSTDSFLLHQDWLSGGVGIQLPLFDGGVTIAQLRRKEKEIAEAVDLHGERVDDIVLEVKRAYLDVREASERIPVARKSIDLGDENLRIVRDQYAQGLLTSADVLTEEDRLSRARRNYTQALYDYHSAFARLVHVAGGTPLEK